MQNCLGAWGGRCRNPNQEEGNSLFSSMVVGLKTGGGASPIVTFWQRERLCY